VNFWRENQTVGILGGKHTQGPHEVVYGIMGTVVFARIHKGTPCVYFCNICWLLPTQPTLFFNHVINHFFNWIYCTRSQIIETKRLN
jgi:hypothetical protein